MRLPTGTIHACGLAGVLAAAALVNFALGAPRWLTLSLGAMAGLVMSTIIVILVAFLLARRPGKDQRR